MSKVGLITDIHIGARNDSPIVTEYQLKFFEDVFVPRLTRDNITTVIIPGDLFDRRKYSNHNTLKLWKDRIFNLLESKQIEVILLVGNHDSVYKNTISVNTPRLVLSEYKNITIIDSPTELVIDGKPFLFLPWICQENRKLTDSLIRASAAEVCFGHFEFGGFEMHSGQIAEDGEDPAKFDKFQMVISGHYHHKSDDGRIFYLGNPYELTWADSGDPRGAHIFDTANYDLEFIKNPFGLFNKVYYNDKDKEDYLKSFIIEGLKDSYVKVIVESKTDPYTFDRLIDSLYQLGLADLKIVESLDVSSDAVDDAALKTEDTPSLLESYIEGLETDLDKDKLKSITKSLYIEALEVQD